MTNDRQLLLFQRSTLLDAAIGSQCRYVERLARVEALREELYVRPDQTTAPQKLKLWNIAMMDALAVAREEARKVEAYLSRVQEIDSVLAQSSAA